MIVVDTSAIAAILLGEPDGGELQDRMADAQRLMLPASCYLECVMVALRKTDGRARLERLIQEYTIAFVPIDEAIVRRAADAFERYGKGRHPAGLNFGDCLSYAAAMQLGGPLLFKGRDFARTDVAVAS